MARPRITKEQYLAARRAGFLVAGYNTPVLYMKQVKPFSAVFIEREKSGNYVCYRLTWEAKPAAGGIHKIAFEKIYCRGSFNRCLSKGIEVAAYFGAGD